MNVSEELSNSAYSFLGPDYNILKSEPIDPDEAGEIDLNSVGNQRANQEKSDDVLNLSILYNALSESKTKNTNCQIQSKLLQQDKIHINLKANNQNLLPESSSKMIQKNKNRIQIKPNQMTSLNGTNDYHVNTHKNYQHYNNSSSNFTYVGNPQIQIPYYTPTIRSVYPVAANPNYMCFPQGYIMPNYSSPNNYIKANYLTQTSMSSAEVGYIHELYSSGCLIDYICSSSHSIIILNKLNKLKEDSANYLFDALYSLNGVLTSIMKNKNAFPIFTLMISKLSTDRKRKVLLSLYDTFDVLAIDKIGSLSLQSLLLALNTSQDIDFYVDLIVRSLKLLCYNDQCSELLINTLENVDAKLRGKLNAQLINYIITLLTRNQFGVSVVSTQTYNLLGNLIFKGNFRIEKLDYCPDYRETQ